MKRNYRAIIEVSGTLEDGNQFEGANRFMKLVTLSSNGTITNFKVNPLKTYEVLVIDNEEDVLDIIENVPLGLSDSVIL